MSLARTALRATVGGLMLGHGLQKLRGSFDGPGLEGTEAMMERLGIHPARHQALAVALSETVGGGLTAAGLFSPLGPAMIIGVMSVATQKVHLQNGLWITNRGYEYNLALAAAALLLAWEGPGALSLDAILRKQRSGPLAGIAALALGVGAGQLAMELSQRLAPAGSGEGSGEGRGGDEAAASD